MNNLEQKIRELEEMITTELELIWERIGQSEEEFEDWLRELEERIEELENEVKANGGNR